MEEITQQQGKNSDKRIANLLPYQFKKGQSGNPGGRPKGASMKQWVQNYLASLNEDERLDFLEGQSKTDIWKMGEGNPEYKSEVKVDGERTISTDELLKIATTLNELARNNTRESITSNGIIADTLDSKAQD